MARLIEEVLYALDQRVYPLTIVTNPDGFLTQDEVTEALRRVSKCEIVVGTAIRLRVHYELYLRRHSDKPAIYILTDGHMLPDITNVANNFTFKIADLFPNFEDKETLSHLSFTILDELYDRRIQGKVTAPRLQSILADLTMTAVRDESTDFGDPVVNLKEISNPDWSDPKTIARISKLFVKVVETGRFDEVTDAIDTLNFDFQHYLDETYGNTLNASPIIKPRCVNGIIPHIRDAYDRSRKVALVVVDGMAYWQYEILRDVLESLQVHPVSEDWIYSWLPSITSLSRQAIFSGRFPSYYYVQSPQNEWYLWLSHWHIDEAQYIYERDGEDVVIHPTCTRLAFVTAALDEKMHSCTSYEDLLALTKIWAATFAKRMQQLKESGFEIILTTDHGNVLARGWRQFTPTEKAHLYGRGSRGHRHAIFRHDETAMGFQRNLDYRVKVLHKASWFAIRDGHSFNTPGVKEMTHGGCHLFECMIPFVKF